MPKGIYGAGNFRVSRAARQKVPSNREFVFSRRKHEAEQIDILIHSSGRICYRAAIEESGRRGIATSGGILSATSLNY